MDVDERESCTMCKVCDKCVHRTRIHSPLRSISSELGNAECRLFVSGHCRCVDREYTRNIPKQSFIIRGFGSASTSASTSASAKAKLTNSNKLETIYGPYKYKSTFLAFLLQPFGSTCMPHLVRGKIREAKKKMTSARTQKVMRQQ